MFFTQNSLLNMAWHVFLYLFILLGMKRDNRVRYLKKIALFESIKLKCTDLVKIYQAENLLFDSIFEQCLYFHCCYNACISPRHQHYAPAPNFLHKDSELNMIQAVIKYWINKYVLCVHILSNKEENSIYCDVCAKLINTYCEVKTKYLYKDSSPLGFFLFSSG